MGMDSHQTHHTTPETIYINKAWYIYGVQCAITLRILSNVYSGGHIIRKDLKSDITGVYIISE